MQEYEKGYGSGPYGIREVNFCHSAQLILQLHRVCCFAAERELRYHPLQSLRVILGCRGFVGLCDLLRGVRRL